MRASSYGKQLDNYDPRYYDGSLSVGEEGKCKEYLTKQY